MFEGYTVRDSRIGLASTCDLYHHDTYLGSYRTLNSLLLDLTLRWAAAEYFASPLAPTNAAQIPRYRGVYGRLYEPIDFLERVVVHAYELPAIIAFFENEDDVCRNSEHFSPQGTGIQKYDPDSRSYVYWKGGPDDITDLSDLINNIRR